MLHLLRFNESCRIEPDMWTWDVRYTDDHFVITGKRQCAMLLCCLYNKVTEIYTKSWSQQDEHHSCILLVPFL